MGCIQSSFSSNNNPTATSLMSWNNLTGGKTNSGGSRPTPVELSGCIKQFMTSEERTKLLASDRLYITSKLLLNPPFITFSAFNDQLFITGFGGLIVDHLISQRIKALVNVSEEIFLDIPSANDSIIYFQFPVRN